MFDVGFLELILIGIIGLLVLGPERLPVAARTLGKWLGKAKHMMNQLSSEVDKQLEIDELKEQLKEQGEHLNINEDIQQIKTTANAVLKDVNGVKTFGGKDFIANATQAKPTLKRVINE